MALYLTYHPQQFVWATESLDSELAQYL